MRCFLAAFEAFVVEQRLIELKEEVFVDLSRSR
jgi:hypothetical protein